MIFVHNVRCVVVRLCSLDNPYEFLSETAEGFLHKDILSSVLHGSNHRCRGPTPE